MCICVGNSLVLCMLTQIKLRFDVSWKKNQNHRASDVDGSSVRPDQVLIRVECESYCFSNTQL